jgi:hypothetical protein
MVAADFMKKFHKSFHSLLLDVSNHALDTLLKEAEKNSDNDELDLDSLVKQVKDSLKTSLLDLAKEDGGKKKTKKAKKDPNAPKGALSAFMIFSNETRPKIKSSEPELKLTEVSKKIGEMWKALTEAQKKPYVKKAEKDKERYEKEKKAFLSKKDTKHEETADEAEEDEE